MINGIQHIGIGVRDRERAHSFYNAALGFSVPISKDTSNCPGVIPLIENDETRKVVIALNSRGGALVELFQYTSRTPAPIPKEIDFSFNGFLFYGLKVKNTKGALDIIESHGGNRVTGPVAFTPKSDAGWKTAMFRDPDGVTAIMMEYPGNNVGYGAGKPRIGGVEYVAIGVSDIDVSTDFYTHILGYDSVLYRTEGRFAEWDAAFGKGRFMKRVLLRRSGKPQGIFRHFLRGGFIELIEVEGNTGRHNFEGRKWGDIGLMELCFDVSDIYGTVDAIERKGIEMAAPPHQQDLGMNTKAVFAYIRDPDGSLIEFADISSLPVPYFMIRLLVNPLVVGVARKLGIL